VRGALTVVQRGERAEFVASSTVALSLSLYGTDYSTLSLERECVVHSLYSKERERVSLSLSGSTDYSLSIAAHRQGRSMLARPISNPHPS